ncbi:MAG: hypothetical protein U0414_19805 [Polyangiaceae bacterium]
MTRPLSSSAMGLVLVALIAALAGALGCEPGLSDPREKPALDLAFFRCHVQPVLVARCGSLLCHGNQERFFRLFGRNRFRPLLGADENRKRNTPLSDKEVQFNFDSALGYVDASAPDESYLLKKPLDQRAYGLYHGGATEYGQGDVFRGTGDPGYETIREWIGGAVEADQACAEPGAGGPTP